MENTATTNEYTRLPPELWLHILSLLHTPELLNAICLSRTFYQLALPLLYQNVSWAVADEQALLRSSLCTEALVRDLNRNGSILEHVRECRILRSFAPHAQSATRSRQRLDTFNVIGTDNAFVSAWRKERDPSVGPFVHIVANHRRRSSLPSTSIAGSILLMTNLRKLSLSNVILPGELINALPDLQNLEELELERCRAETILVLDQTPISDQLVNQRIQEGNGIQVQLLMGDQSSNEAGVPLFNSTTPRWPPRLTRVSLSGIASAPTMFDFRMHGGAMSYDFTRLDGVEQLYATIISPHLCSLRTTSEAFRTVFEAYKKALLVTNATDEHYIPSQLTDFRIVYSNADGGARRLFDFLESFGHRLSHLEIAETTKEECVDLVMLLRDRLGMASHSFEDAKPFLQSLQSFTGPSCLAPLFFQAANIKSLCIRDSFSKVANDILWRDGTHPGAIFPGATNGTMHFHLAQNVFALPSNHTALSPSTEWGAVYNFFGPPEQGAHPKAHLMERIERQVTKYLTNALHTTVSSLKTLAGALERLEFTVVRWDIDSLWMIVQELPQLTALEIRCLTEGPDSQLFESFWGIFLRRLPKLVALHIYDLSKPSLSESSSKDAGSDPSIDILGNQTFPLHMISRERHAFSSFSMTRAIVWNAMAHRTPDEMTTGQGWGYTVREQWVGVVGDDPLARLKPPAQKAGFDSNIWKARSESPMPSFELSESSDEEMTLDAIRPFGRGKGKSLPRGTAGSHDSSSARRHSAHGQRGRTSGGKHLPSRLRVLEMDDRLTSDSGDGDDEWIVPDSEYELDGPLSTIGRRIGPMQPSTITEPDYASLHQPSPQLVPNEHPTDELGGLFPNNFDEGFTPMGNETFGQLAYEGADEVGQSQMGSHPYGHHSSSSYTSSVLSHAPSISDLSHPASHPASVSGRSRSHSTHSFGFQAHDLLYVDPTMTVANEVASRRGSLDNFCYDADQDYEDLTRSAQSLTESQSSSSYSVQSPYPSLDASQFGWANTPSISLTHASTSSATSLSMPHTVGASSGFNVDYQYGSSPYDPNPFDDTFEQSYMHHHHSTRAMYEIVAPEVTANGCAVVPAGYETDTSIYDTGALFDGTYERRGEEMQMQLDKEAEGRAFDFIDRKSVV